MNTHAPRQYAPKSSSDGSESNSEYAEIENLYFVVQERNNILTLAKQLNQMVTGVQLHRGMSMSLLAGSDVFKDEIIVLQRQLERRLAALEIFARHTGGLLCNRDKQSLDNAWYTVRHDWQEDHLIDNFELHSHFVEQLLDMTNALAQKLVKSLCELPSPVGNDTDPKTVYPRAFKQIEVLNFVAQQVPQMIEQIAKIRGLTAYAATVGTVEYTQDRKLRYLIKCAREQNEKLRHQSERLETITEGRIPALINVKTYELKLLHLFDLVERDVLGGTTMTTNSHHLFKLATEIIDAYSTIVGEGWTLIRHWMEQDLESCITLKTVE